MRVTAHTHARTPKTQKNHTRTRTAVQLTKKRPKNLARSHAPPQIDRFCSFFCLFAVVCITLCCDERMSSGVWVHEMLRERGLVRACRSLAKKSLNLAVFLHERVARRSTLLLSFLFKTFKPARNVTRTNTHKRSLRSESDFFAEKKDIVFTSNKTFRGASRRSNPYSIVDAAYAHVIPSSRRRQRW